MIELDVSLFRGVSECWEVSSHAVEVLTTDGRHIRVSARRAMHRRDVFYDAEYEELATLDSVEGVLEVQDRSTYALAEGRFAPVWLPADFPWATGKTVEECLRSGLHWVSSGASQG